jgi:hypothetical protein
MLKVDYLSQRFEGGKVFSFPSNNTPNSTIPLTITYKPPSDFGNITFQYTPTGDTVFDGGIVWMGRGDLKYPVFDPASSFSTELTSKPAPTSSEVQSIVPDQFSAPYHDTTIAQAWTGIAHLTLTRDMIANGASKGLFLYTPSVGSGDPADWDYIWMLYVRQQSK